VCLIGNNIDGAGIFTVLFDSGKGGMRIVIMKSF